MAAEYGFVKPSYCVCANPKAIAMIREFEAEEAIYPGMLCKRGTTDAEAKKNDTSDNAASLLGWAGFEQASMDDRPATIDTQFAANSTIPILNGPGMFIRAYVVADITTTVGEYLQPSANYDGGLDAGAASDVNVAIALEAKTASGLGTAGVVCWVMSLI
jgi:hypothetical protein